jgi:Ca2+-binding EF-hand superfamily protein
MQQSALDLKTIIYERFKPIFLAYDKDQNATLEPNELRALLADNLGVSLEDISQEQLDWHFNRIDLDKDGKITFDEYVTFP